METEDLAGLDMLLISLSLFLVLVATTEHATEPAEETTS